MSEHAGAGAQSSPLLGEGNPKDPTAVVPSTDQEKGQSLLKPPCSSLSSDREASRAPSLTGVARSHRNSRPSMHLLLLAGVPLGSNVLRVEINNGVVYVSLGTICRKNLNINDTCNCTWEP